jgi:DNA-binding NtrC family response regulator
MGYEEITQRAQTKILVVDDDLTIRQFLEAVLLSNGYMCVCVEDGLAAINLLKNDTFDMVISDIEMPRLNGFELLSYVKKRYPQIKFIMISGQCRPNDSTHGLSTKDAHHFLAKPFPVNLLLTTVNTVLLCSEQHY